jgi:hypothetical protein
VESGSSLISSHPVVVVWVYYVFSHISRILFN